MVTAPVAQKKASTPAKPNVYGSTKTTKAPTKDEGANQKEMVETSMGNMSLDEFLDIMSLPEEEADKKIAQKKEEQERIAYEKRVQDILEKARTKKQNAEEKTEKMVDRLEQKNNRLKNVDSPKTGAVLQNAKDEKFENNYSNANK